MENLSQTVYVIYSTDELLFWSNEDGWVDLTNATKFSQDEKDSLNLPIKGKWVEFNVAKSLEQAE